MEKSLCPSSLRLFIFISNQVGNYRDNLNMPIEFVEKSSNRDMLSKEIEFRLCNQ